MSKKDDILEELLINQQYPLEVIEEPIIEAQVELDKNFENYLHKDGVAYFKALPFGANPELLAARFDVDFDASGDEFTKADIERAANKEIKLLKKHYPDLFGSSRFGYEFIWDNAEGFGLYVTLTKENYNKKIKASNPSYEPLFLDWCKSYEQEVQELKELIEGHPADARLLKQEYEQLTGKKYRKSTSQKSMEKKPKLKLIKSENPTWVSDEALWEEAKKKSLKEYGKISYPFVVFIYKRMGGKVKKKK